MLTEQTLLFFRWNFQFLEISISVFIEFLAQILPEYELWNRLTRPRKTQKTYIFRDDIRNSLGEVYGGARVWQESCAWGREKVHNAYRPPGGEGGCPQKLKY